MTLVQACALHLEGCILLISTFPIRVFWVVFVFCCIVAFGAVLQSACEGVAEVQCKVYTVNCVTLEGCATKCISNMHPKSKGEGEITNGQSGD